MAHSRDKTRRNDIGNGPRHPSDDVTSLDSWSEVASSPDWTSASRTSSRSNSSRSNSASDEVLERDLRHSGSNDGVVLIPGKLDTIHEPREPKVTRISLQKATPQSYFSPPVTLIATSVESSHGRHTPPHSESSSPLYHQHSARHQMDKYNNRMPKESNSGYHYHSSSGSRQPYDQQYGSSSQHTGRNNCTCHHCESYRQQHSKTPDMHYKSKKSSHLNRKHVNGAGQQAPLRHHHHRHVLSAHNGSDFSHDVDQIDQGEKVKNKLLSVWNNVKYGWTLKTKTNFRVDSPIFLLGRIYHKRPDDEEPMPGEVSHSPPSMELFKQDFESRLWFTYRRDFQALPNTKFTTDCGWGCMLRSGQMMIAQGFIQHFLGRDWRVHSQTSEQETFYRHVIQWFGDSSSDQCPFSVHHLAEIGKMHGKQPGDWYGPASVSYILREALRKAPSSQPVLKDLCIYVAQDSTVYKQDVIDMCTARERSFSSSVDSESEGPSAVRQTKKKPGQNEWKRAVIILVPVRLGGEEFNSIYTPCIKNLMAQETCLGIIGGKPKHSLYFLGWQEDKLIYLDPHYCQDYVDTLKRDFKIESFHCFSPRKIAIGKMDPSGTVGFYCRTREDFDRFVEHTVQMVTPDKGTGLYPMFVFSEGRGCEADLADLSLSDEKYLRVRHVELDSYGRVRSSTLNSEEFVVL